MVNGKALIEAAIKALEEYYVEYGSGRDIQYTFGFFDALAALKDFQKTLPSDRKRVLDVV